MSLLYLPQEKIVVTMSDVEEAKDKVMMGAEEDPWLCQKMRKNSLHTMKEVTQ